MTAISSSASRPLLSILLPVYNVAPYLEECVHSIFNQGGGDAFEVILLDDCSTDGSAQLADKLRSQYQGRLQLLHHHTNGGLSAARNSLLAASKGSYIWFLDSDDKLWPGSLSRLLDILNDHAPDIVLCDYSKDDGPQIPSFYGPAHTLQQDTQALVCGIFAARKMHSWSKITSRSLWGDDLRFPVGELFEDVATTPYLLLRSQSYYYAAEKWIYYRQRHDSILGLISRSKSFDVDGHRHLAGALNGFKKTLGMELGDIKPATQFAIAHFLARSFTMIGFKLIRERLFKQSWQETRSMMAGYALLAEAESPITFSALQRAYWNKRIYARLAVLWFFRAISDQREVAASSYG